MAKIKIPTLASVWTRRECFAARKRMEMLWTKARRLAFAHSIPTLIHPFPTLRQGPKVLDGRSFNNNNISCNFLLKNDSEN